MHAIIKLFSLFITDKNKRKLFKEKYDPIERHYRLLLQTRKDFALHMDLQHKYLHTFSDAKYLNFKYAISQNFISDYRDHIENVKNLQKGLDPEALKNLETLLARIELADHINYIDNIKSYYTDEEWQDFLDYISFYKELHKEEGYYQYKEFKLPTNALAVSVFKNNQGLHKLKTLKFLSKDSAIIDAGAYICDSALIFRKFCPSNPIYAFEPISLNYETGLKTIALNKLENIIFERMALGDQNKTITVEYCKEGLGLAGGIIKDAITESKTNHFYETITCTTIDNYVERKKINHVGLIKTDVEGFEQNLIKGALNTIKRNKPILMISIYHNYNDFYKIKPMLDSLNLGYKFNFYHADLEHPVTDTLLLAEVY